MTEFFEEFERTKREITAPLREQAGFPSDPEAQWEVDAEVMLAYISALENALTAERHVGRLLYRRRPLRDHAAATAGEEHDERDQDDRE
jgi:hypothetical protein